MGEDSKPTCFVVMGFGTKPDLATSRNIDLDKTYKYIIKPAAVDAGYECIRADEIQHAGVIDVPMYEQLLNADLVIADLSTSNVNAFFELGIRYALRPRTTIVIAEEGFKNPFDTNHITCRRFRHNGEALDIEEVERFKPELSKAIRQIAEKEIDDSPVYTFLGDLVPPTLARAAEAAIADDRVKLAQDRLDQADTEEAKHALREPMAKLMEQAAEARKNENFVAMRAILEGVRFAQGNKVDDFVLQQLALATYKAKDRDVADALNAAREILIPLEPDHSLDPETIGLWAAIHKRLAELDGRTGEQRAKDLDTAISSLERGFTLKHDYYNGINLAYLLNVRAAQSAAEDAIADQVAARRIRHRVIPVCLEILNHPIVGESEKGKAEQEYWVRASLAEAYAGIGDDASADEQMKIAKEMPPPENWMLASTEDQIAKLRALLV